MAEPLVIRPIPQHHEVTGVPLARVLLEQIKADQSAWNQGSWYSIPGANPQHSSWLRDEDDAAEVLAPDVHAYIMANRVVPWDCGTGCCVAGHAVFAHGATLDHRELADLRDGGPVSGGTVITRYGVQRDVGSYARELLNLSYEQSGALFHADNDLDDLERMVSALEADPNASLEMEDGWNAS